MPDTPHHQNPPRDAQTPPTANTPDTRSAFAIARSLGPAAVLGAAWLALPILGSIALFWQIRPISEWLREQGDLGPVIFAAAFTLAAGVGVLPTYAQAALGGWAFGPVTGTLAAEAGFVGAALLGYAIASRAARRRVAALLDSRPDWAAVRDALVASGPLRTLGIVTLVRIPPNSPFSFTNLVLATTGVPLWSYALGTALGMLPRTAAVVWIGSLIQGEFTKDAVREARPGWVLWAGIATAVIAVIVIGQIGQAALRRVTASTASAAPPPEPSA